MRIGVVEEESSLEKAFWDGDGEGMLSEGILSEVMLSFFKFPFYFETVFSLQF